MRDENLLDKLVVSLEPFGFKIDGFGPPEEYDFYCEDVGGYDCQLFLELHPDFVYALAWIYPSEHSPDEVDFDIKFPLKVTAQEIYDWVLACAKQLADPGSNYEITIEGE
ncbi:MAG: hypothetical protein L0Z50_06020 [Verrucomicrobiales bacterium]|nr:hypothetical protein [Verrucomicrobiales bacterium]